MSGCVRRIGRVVDRSVHLGATSGTNKAYHISVEHFNDMKWQITGTIVQRNTIEAPFMAIQENIDQAT